jgi:hypothetical protein
VTPLPVQTWWKRRLWSSSWICIVATDSRNKSHLCIRARNNCLVVYLSLSRQHPPSQNNSSCNIQTIWRGFARHADAYSSLQHPRNHSPHVTAQVTLHINIKLMLLIRLHGTTKNYHYSEFVKHEYVCDLISINKGKLTRNCLFADYLTSGSCITKVIGYWRTFDPRKERGFYSSLLRPLTSGLTQSSVQW